MAGGIYQTRNLEAGPMLPERRGEMRRFAVFFVMLLSMTVVLVPTTQAADEVAGRNVGHTQKSEMMEVGDVPGHFMGVSQIYGFTFYTKGPSAGEIVPRMSIMNFDVVKGKGTATGYETKTFKDGSTLILKWSCTLTPVDGGKRTAFEGPWEVIAGTGRYAGVKGSGTWKGERIGDNKTGGDSYNDFTGTITK